MTLIASLSLVAAQLLFNSGVQDAQAGKLERARLTLQTLIHMYPGDPLASEAKTEIDAIQLYEEGQDRMRQGRYETAEFTFQTLLSVYPESPLVKQAEDAMHAAARAHQALTVCLTVRRVDFKELGLPDSEVRSAFDEREVRLGAGRAFDPRDVEEARLALTALLAERGSAGALIRTEARMAGEHQVDVVLTRVK